MPNHIQIRIISLLEEAANSFEQLETLANRTLTQIPGEQVEAVELRSIERDYMNNENEPGSGLNQSEAARPCEPGPPGSRRTAEDSAWPARDD